MQVLLGSVFFAEQFLLNPVQSVLKPAVLFDELNVFFGQVLFVLSEEIDFAALGFFLIETRVGASVVARSLLVVETKLFFNELFLLFGELVVSE